jgi:hypothetical protein
VENKFYKWFENFLSSKPEEYSDEMLKSYQAGHNSRDEEFEYLKREVHVACAFLTWYDEYAAKAILVRIKEKYEQTD